MCSVIVVRLLLRCFCFVGFVRWILFGYACLVDAFTVIVVRLTVLCYECSVDRCMLLLFG